MSNNNKFVYNDNSLNNIIQSSSSFENEEEDEIEENYVENMKNVYKIAFEMFDTEKNNYLNAEQLTLVMQSLGYDLSKNEIEDMMFSILKNEKTKNYDRINLSQFQKLMNLWRQETDVFEEYLEAFRVFDDAGTGIIRKDEIEKILIQYGKDVSKEDIKYMLNDADVNNDGKIDYKNFVRLLLNK